MSGVLDTYLQETLGSQEKPLQKTHEKGGKKEETWVRTKPKNSTTFLRSPPKITIIIIIIITIIYIF